MHVHRRAGRRPRYPVPVTAPAYEYRRATWAEVCDLGPKGWRMVAVPPIVEMKAVLGQMQAGEPLYAMERECATAQTPGIYDHALARAGQLHAGGMSGLGALGLAADEMCQEASGGPA